MMVTMATAVFVVFMIFVVVVGIGLSWVGHRQEQYEEHTAEEE